jgi:hypothetical protein
MPDLAVMDAATCAALAQVLPVLFIALLFEARARPDAQRTPAGILVGFVGNLAIALLSICLELLLLGGLQNDRGVVGDATWVWLGCIFIFAWVVVRWASTTAAIQMAAQLVPASQMAASLTATGAELRLGFSRVMREYTSVMQFAFQVLAAPSQVMVDVVQALAVVSAEVVKTFGGVFRSAGAFFVGAVSAAMALLRPGRH